jgi:hypothetical protein
VNEMPSTATLDRNAELWLARVKREIAERQAAGNPPHPPVGPDAPGGKLTSEERTVLLNGTYMGRGS